MARPAWYLQQLFPPLLLSYFAWACKVCSFEIGPIYIAQQLNHPHLARAYSLIPTIVILPITLLYTTLYFLPSSQSIPPAHPPASLSSSIHQCLSPSEALAVRTTNGEPHDPHEPLVDRCYKGRCRGRWKPARARHCSECGTCRMGFDHHCALFANCLTAPHIPTFLLLLLYTPPATFLISCPIYLALAKRARLAYASSWTIPRIREGWYAKWWSWIVVGGPIGRVTGGTILAWREMDRLEREQGINTGLRLGVGLVIALGILLAMITGALAYTTITLILQGSLTIDRERRRSHSRALVAISALQAQGRPVPPQLIRDTERWGERRWFFVPLPVEPRLGDDAVDSIVPGGAVGVSTGNGGDGGPLGNEGGVGGRAKNRGVMPRSPRSERSGRTNRTTGVVVQSEMGERPYDLGSQGNWKLLMGAGWGWLAFWNALLGRRGLREDDLWNWPVTPEAERGLRTRAEEVARDRRWVGLG